MRHVRGLFSQDRSLKLLAILLAALLWLQATAIQNQPQVATFNVPVRLTNRPDGLVRVGGSRITVAVTVRGGLRQLNELRTGGATAIEAVVDLAGARAGRGAFSVSVTLPRGIDLESVSPAEVIIELDRLTSRQFPILVRFDGQLGPDFQAGSPVVEPARVELSGPAGRIEQVAAVWATVQLQGGASEIAAKVMPVPVDASGQAIPDLRTEPSQVAVAVPVVRLPPGAALPVQVVWQGALPEGYVMDPPEVQPALAQVRAGPEVLAGLESVSTQPIDLTGKTGPWLGEVALRLPDGVAAVQPGVVSVRLNIRPDLIERTLEALPIAVANLAPELRATVAPATVSLRFEGLRSSIESLSAADVQVSLSAQGLGPGIYRLRPSVSISRNDVRLVGDPPAAVTVTIEQR